MPGDRQSASERLHLAERRRRVMFLKAVQNLSAAEISEVLSVSTRTVQRDLAAAREQAVLELRTQAEAAESITSLATDIDAALAAISREAWVAVISADPNSPQRVRALQIALAAIVRRAEVLRSLGLLTKEPGASATGLGLLGLSDQELKEELRKLRGEGGDA